MSDATMDESYQDRIRRLIAESDARMAVQNKVFEESLKRDADAGLLFRWGNSVRVQQSFAYVTALMGLIVGGLGLAAGTLIAMGRHM